MVSQLSKLPNLNPMADSDLLILAKAAYHKQNLVMIPLDKVEDEKLKQTIKAYADWLYGEKNGG